MPNEHTEAVDEVRADRALLILSAESQRAQVDAATAQFMANAHYIEAKAKLYGVWAQAVGTAYMLVIVMAVALVCWVIARWN